MPVEDPEVRRVGIAVIGLRELKESLARLAKPARRAAGVFERPRPRPPEDQPGSPAILSGMHWSPKDDEKIRSHP